MTEVETTIIGLLTKIRDLLKAQLPEPERKPVVHCVDHDLRALCGAGEVSKDSKDLHDMNIVMARNRRDFSVTDQITCPRCRQLTGLVEMLLWVPPFFDQTPDYQAGYLTGSQGKPQARWQTAAWKNGWRSGRANLYAEQDRGWRFNWDEPCDACGVAVLFKDGEEERVCSYNGCRYTTSGDRLDVDRHIRRLEGAERYEERHGTRAFRKQT